MRRIFELVRADKERGQAMILFAIMATALFATMGLAVEGGRIFVTYRAMQSAADMAALVGAQKLPSNATQAQSDACSYAQKNGFGNGACSGTAPSPGASAVQACAPPVSQSPYNGAPYGSTTPCGASTSNYIEVQIQDNLGTIPVFGTPVTLYAHAVARHGISGVVDYTIAALDTGSSNGTGITFGGSNGIVSAGSVFSNSTYSSAIATNGGGTNQACGGQFLTAANETSVPSGLQTFQDVPSTSVNFAPASCSGTPDATASFQPNSGFIQDPYGSTVAPDWSKTTAGNGSMATNCSQCAGYAWYYTWASGQRNNGTWTQETAADTHGPSVTGTNLYEFYPGYYPAGITMSGGTAIFNPGVYTLGSQLKVTGGTICIYGSPACGVLLGTTSAPSTITTNSCAGADFTIGDASYVPPSTWYYYCSPWGIYDTATHNGRSGGSAPVFLDTSTSTPFASTAPLNGVTFVLNDSGHANSSGVSISGNSKISLAFPNPCSGKGAFTGTQVDFPDGASSTTSTYTYPATSYPGQDGTGTNQSYTYGSPAQTYNQLYPDANLKIDGECPERDLNVWQGEFGTNGPQHLHFLFFAQNADAGISVTGTGGTAYQNLWGIIHTFPANVSGVPSPAPNCSVSISGSAGGTNGPPMLVGQIIADNVSFGGSSVVEVFNRPTGQASGAGSSLVQ